MELSNNDKILISIYKLYNEDINNMEDEINAEKIGITFEDFKIALDKLSREGLIEGVKFANAGKKPPLPYWDKVNITTKGIEYVENNIGIKNTLEKNEKIKYVLKECFKSGWEEIKDIGTSYAAKCTAELIKK